MSICFAIVRNNRIVIQSNIIIELLGTRDIDDVTTMFVRICDDEHLKATSQRTIFDVWWEHLRIKKQLKALLFWWYFDNENAIDKSIVVSGIHSKHMNSVFRNEIDVWFDISLSTLIMSSSNSKSFSHSCLMMIKWLFDARIINHNCLSNEIDLIDAPTSTGMKADCAQWCGNTRLSDYEESNMQLTDNMFDV